MNVGIAVQCQGNQCSQVNWDLNRNQGGFEFFRAYNDGFSGYVPTDGMYNGNGEIEAPSILDNEEGHHATIGESPIYVGRFAEPQHPDKTIASAVDSARTILSTDNDCSKFFGENATKALDKFEEILTRGYPEGPGNTRLGIRQSGPQITHHVNNELAFRTFERAVINNAGPFFNMLSTSRIGGYNPNSRQSQTLQILHELAHLIYKDGQPLIANDGDQGQKSEDNTKIILKDCRKEVDKIKN